MKIHVELNSEEEFIQFTTFMEKEKHNLASVLYSRYRDMYEDTAERLRKLQEKIDKSSEDLNKYYAIDITDPFSEFEFNARAYNCLKAEQIPTIGHLLEYSERDLLKIINMGKKSVEHIKEVLAEHGLTLRTEEKK